MVGPDFALGRGREGDVSALQKLGQQDDFFVKVVPPLKIRGEVVSSTLIREALAKGEVSRVVRLTGPTLPYQGTRGGGDRDGEGVGLPDR